MSDQPQQRSDASGQDASLVPSQEFYLRVNDFIQMANRIERRYDTHHAQLAMLHAFSRYGAHHFRTTSADKDDVENREAFAEYIGSAVKQLVLGHLDDMVGPAPASVAPAAVVIAASEAATDAAPDAASDAGAVAGADPATDA